MASLQGGFRYGPRDLCSSRKRLGTTVDEMTYEEIVRITSTYKLKFSEIIDEATASGNLENAAKSVASKRAVPSVK